MKRKRVLLLTPACQGADGLSAYSRRCIDALADAADLEVWSLAESDDRARPLPHGVKSFFASGGKRRFVLRGLRNALSPPDAVFCTHLNVAPVALPMVFTGARLFVGLLGVEAWRPLRPREAFALRRAAKLVAISQHTIRGFHAANPRLASVPVDVCHLCLPGDSSPASSPEPPEAPFALIVARMSSEERYKGHDLLLEIWPEIRREVPSARLKIVGGGDDKGRLEAKRNELGLQECVEFLGRVGDDELKRLYAQCSFFAMPSRREGFGLVFLEAMRAGKACIGAAGSASEIIENEKTGYVLDAGDRKRIREACVRLFADPSLAKALGEAGRRREAAAFGRDAFRRKMTAIVLGAAADR